MSGTASLKDFTQAYLIFFMIVRLSGNGTSLFFGIGLGRFENRGLIRCRCHPHLSTFRNFCGCFWINHLARSSLWAK